MVVTVAPSVAACLFSEETAYREAVSVAPWHSKSADVRHPSPNNHNGLLKTFKMDNNMYATVMKKDNGYVQGPTVKKCVNFAQNEDIVRCLEMKYGGKVLAHHSAIIIQRAFRASRLKRQFSRLISLAMSSDRLDKRMSLLGPDMELDVDSGMMVTVPPPKLQSPVEKVEAEIDKLILEAAGLIQQSQNQSPSQRHIKNRRNNNNVRRSVSMRNGPLQKSDPLLLQKDLKSRDDLDLSPSSPVPPCPPLRGIYNNRANNDPIYVTRDSLYCHQQNVNNEMRANLPPRPPQRTVSFLNYGTLPRKVSDINKSQSTINEHKPFQRINNSDSDLRVPPGHLVPQTAHNRSLSTPTHISRSQNSLYINTRDTATPLPPPPYISPPPHPKSATPLPPPPPVDSVDNIEMINNLPPPPEGLPSPPLFVAPAPATSGSRQPCDSASSSSSIDSGYGRSCLSEKGMLIQQMQNNRNGIQYRKCSFNQPSGSPEVVFEPRPMNNGEMSHYNHHHHLFHGDRNFNSTSCNSNSPSPNYGYISQQPLSRNVVTHPNLLQVKNEVNNFVENNYNLQNQANSISENNEIYGKLSNNYMMQQQQSSVRTTPKKTVRIQTPADTSQTSQLVEDDVFRRRQYRVGLNLFNQNSEMGMEYLLKKNFLDFSPAATAKFLLGRKGISKTMIGEYLCSLQRPFNLASLHCFVHEMDFSGLHLDIALRQLQQEVTLPKEAQKIEKMVEIFSKRYIQCNQMFVAGFRSPDTIFVLSYAIVLLNTDLHSRAVRPNRRMRREDFVRNLKGIDAGADLDQEMLQGIYDRIKASEFKPGSDHVSQVSKVEDTITGRSKNAKSLAETHRRLVCFCRLTEVLDLHKKERKQNVHQRGVFLFNDLLVVTKSVTNKKKTLHQYRSALNLSEIRINVFSTDTYEFGIQLQDRLTGKEVGTFNARSQSDRQRLVHDLEEAVAETAEMQKAKMFLNQDTRQVVEPEETFC